MMGSLRKAFSDCFLQCFRSDEQPKPNAATQTSSHCSSVPEKTVRNGILIQTRGVVPGVSEAEMSEEELMSSRSDWKLLENLERGRFSRWNTGKFLTLHKRRKKRPATKSLNFIDDLYHGPTRHLLRNIGDWPFNAFALDRATGGRPLAVLSFHLFHRYGLMTHFAMDPVRVWKFFTLVEEGYHGNNPYHNAIHAADVTQAMHCFLQEQKILRNLEPLEILASLIAAMTHDLDHPGVNQPFLVATSNHLASLYKNASVLENHHWRAAMGCLEESGVLELFDDNQRKNLQTQIQSLILATDIARQQEFLTAFREHLDNSSLDLSSAGDRHFTLQIALKCADIGNPCRPWEVSQAWSLQVSEEFYRQGDLERKLGLPVTLLCDRYSSTVSKIQSGFFRFIAAPLFEQWHRFQDTQLSKTMLQHLRINQVKWESILAREEHKDPQFSAAQTNTSSHPADNWAELGTLQFPSRIPFTRRRHSIPHGRPRALPARRESLPAGLWENLDLLSVDDVVRDTSITSISPWETQFPKRKESPATQCSEDKENSCQSKVMQSRIFNRRGSAPVALLPINTNSVVPNTKFVRQGSLRLPAASGNLQSPPLKRRGSLPYEFGRKIWSTINDSVNCWSSKDRRKNSIRRRRSGGPELFASAVRRGSIITQASAQLPPLPQGTSCFNTKAKRAPSPQCSQSSTLIGSCSGSRDLHAPYWSGRRGSGPMELLAGIWTENLSLAEDVRLEEVYSHTPRFEMKRPSIGSSSSGSDGTTCSSMFQEDWVMPPVPSTRRTRRRGSFPVENGAIFVGELGSHWMLNPR